MISEADEEPIDDDIVSKELLQQDFYENSEDNELTRLTEMVRKHYLNYLEKQLQENLLNSKFCNNKNNSYNIKDCDEEFCKKSIKKTAELLEDKAVKACMIAKFYQRAMVKIIAIVRRTTQEKRLITHLEDCIQKKNDHDKLLTATKETQTEAGLLHVETYNYNDTYKPKQTNDNDPDKPIMSLDEKIEMFQKHLQKEKTKDIAKKYPHNQHQNIKRSHRREHHNRHHEKHKAFKRHQQHHDQDSYEKHKHEEIYFSPTCSSTITEEHTTPITLETKIAPTISDNKIGNTIAAATADPEVNENSNDSVAEELARLFSEEKTELDEIFGIDPNQEPDDPQICKILKEIEDSKITQHHQTVKENQPPTHHITNPTNESLDIFPETNCSIQPLLNDSSLNSVDLSKSIWPCELFMQRRKLSESLARLIEEDLRWHDIMKWKFSQLFGEDSDDEFTLCSPSIELDEVLVGSCIRRISPWVVKHLMKPMKDGLIGNRFLFKKLAKTLARAIVMENQYPDEFVIKECVENFFCLHQAVMSLEDLDVDMPSISSY